MDRTIEQTREYMSGGDLEVSSEEILAVLGREEYDEFMKVMQIVQGIIDHPEQYVGSKALVEAARLAAIRNKIGMRGQYYKTAARTDLSRKRKDLLLTMYAALEENINTLKLLGRIEASMRGSVL